MKKQKHTKSVKTAKKNPVKGHKSFKNLKLKGKLILLTLLIAGISSISSFFAISYINTVTGRSNVAVQYYGIAQGDAGKAVVVIGESRQSVRDVLTFEMSTATFVNKYNDFKTRYGEYEQKIIANAYSQAEKDLCTAITGQSKAFYEKADAIIEEAKTLSHGERRSMFLVIQKELDPLYEELYGSYDSLMQLKTDTAHAEFANIRRQNTITFIILLAVVALAGTAAVAVGAVFARKLANAIKKLLDVSKQIAEGNLDAEVKINSKDEIGQLAEGFSQMTHNLKSIIGDVEFLLGQMSHGDFSVDTQHSENYVGNYRNILTAVQGINSSLSSTMSEINMASDQVNMGSGQVSSGAQALSQGSTEQAASVEELSSTIAEVAEQIKVNADHAVEASRMSDAAGQQVVASNQQMQRLVSAMEDISDTSNQISKIIKTIDDIAFQTNILALNAAVEAARAGSAGKGFAVVADEVRNLAGKSAEAAKNTTDLIENTLAAISRGTVMAEETAKSLKAVVDKASAVDDTIQKIAEASEKQATSIAQITSGIDQISSVVQTNSATAEQSAAASQELTGQARALRELVDKFKLKPQEELPQEDLFDLPELPEDMEEIPRYDTQYDMAEPVAAPVEEKPYTATPYYSDNDKY